MKNIYTDLHTDNHFLRQLKKIMAKQPSRNPNYLPPCSSRDKRNEYRAQSQYLRNHWLKELKEVGYWNSTTATAFATHPLAIKYLCDQLQLHQLEDGDSIEEYGPGMGAIAREILRSVDRAIKYNATEINPIIARDLIDWTPDKRFTVRLGSATEVGKICTEQRQKAKLVLTSIPFSSDTTLTREVLEMTKEEVLEPGGKFLLWNFNPVSVWEVIKIFGWKNCQLGFTPFCLPPLLTVLARIPEEHQTISEEQQLKEIEKKQVQPLHKSLIKISA